MHKYEYVFRINDILNQAILNNISRRWDENLITADILTQLLKGLQGTTLDGNRPVRHLEWDAYKLSGKEETLHGDIGIIVRTVKSSGAYFDGVGFVEAKRRFSPSGIWDSWNVDQCKRILKNTKHPILLFYDFEKSNQHALYRGTFTKKSEVFAYSMPMDLAPYVANEKGEIESHSLPFAWQIVSRFLSGYDLDYDPLVVKELLGFSEKNRLPMFVVSVVIGEGREVVKASRIQINDNFFTRLSSGRDYGNDRSL